MKAFKIVAESEYNRLELLEAENFKQAIDLAKFVEKIMSMVDYATLSSIDCERFIVSVESAGISYYTDGSGGDTYEL